MRLSQLRALRGKTKVEMAERSVPSMRVIPKVSTMIFVIAFIVRPDCDSYRWGGWRLNYSAVSMLKMIVEIAAKAIRE